MEPNNLNRPNPNIPQFNGTLKPNSMPPTNIPKINIPTASGDFNKKVFIVISLIVVLVLAGVLWWMVGSKKVATNVVATAQKGKIVAGFDPKFIFVSDANIFSSTHTSVKSKTTGDAELFSTVYTTQSTLKDLFTAYNDFLSRNGYKVLNSSLTENKATIFAGIGGDTIAISIINEPNNIDRKVSISISRISTPAK